MDDVELYRFDVERDGGGTARGAALRSTVAERPSSSGSSTTLPLCLFLYGGGGSSETLLEIAPVLGGWWRAGRLAPMLVATPDVGPWSFYLDDPTRGLDWESFVVDRFLRYLRTRFDVSNVGLVGISMGGYGALKIAFARPRDYVSVAAVSPMIEPALEADDVPLRNRYHYPPEVPAALLGPERDAALYGRDHPAGRARAHAEAIRGSGLAIYVDAAGRDVLHAHDGAEFLHRTLWDLDVEHEYRLRRDADHIGRDLVERLYDAFAWVGAHLAPAEVPPSNLELARRELHLQLAPARTSAEVRDPTMARRYGRMPVRP